MSDVELQQRRDALLVRRGFENRNKVPGYFKAKRLFKIRGLRQETNVR
jgi:hypothetical protein